MTQSSIFGPWPGQTDATPATTDDVQGTLDGGGVPWPFDAPELYDQITIAGAVFKCLTIPSGELSCKLDVKNPKGADGATITDDGTEAESGEIQITMWNRDQWKDYIRILPSIAPNAVKGTRQPVDIAHPMLNLHGISRVYIEKMTIPVRGATKGTLEFRLRYRGWRPAPKTPEKSKTKTDDSSKAHTSIGVGGVDNLLPNGGNDPNYGTDKWVQKNGGTT